MNSAGLELVTQNNPFPAYFSVFSSAEHFRVLIDEDIVSVLGQGLDELVRHHPSLKELVMKAFIAAMELGLTVKTEILQEQLSLYSFDLQRAAPGELESDVKMVQADVKAEEAKDPVHVHCIEVIARVCCVCVCVLWKGRHKDSRHTIHHTSFSSLKAFSRMRSIAKSLSI